MSEEKTLTINGEKIKVEIWESYCGWVCCEKYTGKELCSAMNRRALGFKIIRLQEGE